MLGVMFALLSAMCFATNFILIQLGMEKSKKDNGIFINIIINVFVLCFIYLIVFIFRENPVTITVPGVVAFVIAGFFTTFLGRASVFAGIRRIGSSRAAAIKNTSPVFTILFAVLFINETISWLNGLGILFVLSGLFLTGYEQWKKNGFSVKDNMWVGILFGGFGSICFGIGFAVRKMGLQEIPDPVLGSLIGALVALISFSTFLGVKGQLMPSISSQFKEFNLFYILGGFATSFGSLTFFISAYFTQVSYTVTIIAIEPVLTLILAYLFLRKQEEIKRTMIVSTILIFIGITVLALSP
jgi:drug/metabolite transporter (DMT)-like permease